MATALLYTITTGADISLAAGTAKSVLAAVAASGRVVELAELGIGFDATAATREAVLVELCASTQATAGTSTSVTPTQILGRAVTPAFAGAKNYTAEPTVLTPISEWLVEPKSGLLVVQFPLGEQPLSPVGGALTIRCTAPDAVNCRAYMRVRE